MEALALAEKELEMQERPEERNWLREHRGMMRAKFESDKERAEYDKMMRPVYEAAKIMAAGGELEDTAAEIGKRTTWENYDAMKEMIDSIGSKVYSSMGGKAAFNSPVPPRQWWIDQADGDEALAREIFERYKTDWFKTRAERKATKPEAEELEYKETESGEIIGLPKKVKPGTTPSPRPTGIKGKPKESKTSIHYEVSDSGEVTKIVSDAQGNTVSKGSLGKIGKTKEGRSPSDFEKKWALSLIIARDALGREPSEAEIADVYKSKFGMTGWFDSYMGGPGGKGKDEPLLKF
ncbi:MAG: hypothetical protein FJ088_16475 [Deltaproteobacteria bacterium]|nr:hypothetical protein [Deltaproteobacteria bacterium]